jgi:hypothetical protein
VATAATQPVALQVEVAYRAFWPVLATFDRRYPQPRWPAVLGQVAVDPALSQALAVAAQQRRTGVVLYGRPLPRAPQVTLGRGDKASVADCVDFSHYGQADAASGRRTTVGRPRTRVVVALARGADGRWRAADVTFPGGGC